MIKPLVNLAKINYIPTLCIRDINVFYRKIRKCHVGEKQTKSLNI